MGDVDDSGGEVDGGRKLYYHLTLLAENNRGYKNLIQLASRAFLEGYYYKPRIDWDLLGQHSEGVIATTGCLGGHVLQSLMNESFDAALAKAARLQDIFGRDSLFVELQDHGIPEQRRTNPQLLEIARRIGAPLLATNDSHYVRQGDAVAHDALLCVQTGSQMSDPDRFRFHGDHHYLKTAREMRGLFDELPAACDNTLWIAERCDVEIEFGKPQLPDFPLPAGFSTDAEYLEHLTFEGAHARWGDQLPDEAVERLAYELRVIGDMGFSSYFLITWDLIRHARELDIRVGPGRGSAAGCAVAYCLRITDLDPIRYDLLFERFLNPSRVSMPDIDMDFDSRYRDEMIRYAAERYGRDHVAQIVTFSTIKARAAVRDAARVLGHPWAVGDKIAKAMPPLIMGRDTPLHACLEQSEKFADGYKMAAELRDIYATDTVAKQVIDVAKGLEGLRRQDGIHAAAVVITKESLTEYLPIQRKPESGQDPQNAPIVTQYEMGGVEELGLLKMDFLGLRNLDVITDTLGLIHSTRGVQVDIDNVDLSDGPTYELLRRGETIGVFQLEGGPMRALIKALAPTEFEDVAALVALYRPGPMAQNMHTDYADRKNGRQEVSYLHEDAKESLGDTYGLMIYQESMMRIAQRFAGYSLADADNLRKACGKKNKALIAKERVKFVQGCEGAGYGTELGTAWFDIIEPFADYAFNRSHAYGYGFVAYQTAYLKANYGPEYLSALLTSVKASLDKAAVYLAECRAMGIEVVVPDINHSASDFTPDVSDPDSPRILFGLSAVRNVGEGLVELIVSERDSQRALRGLLRLLRAGRHLRAQQAHDRVVDQGRGVRLARPSQDGSRAELRADPRHHGRTPARARHGRAVALRLPSVTDHRSRNVRWFPMSSSPRRSDSRTRRRCSGSTCRTTRCSGWSGCCHARPTARIADLEELEDGTSRQVGGVVTALQRKWTKQRRPDGGVHPRGPPGLDRGDGVPEDDDGHRPPPRGRRRGDRRGRLDRSRRHAEVDRNRPRVVRAGPFDENPPLRLHLHPTGSTTRRSQASRSSSGTFPARPRCTSSSGTNRSCACPTSSS